MNFKRIIAGITAVMMIGTGFNFSDYQILSDYCVVASAEETTNGVLDNGLAYEIRENEDGTKYAVITSCTDRYAESIVIPSEINGISVTSISIYAFYGCTGLTSITIPDSVTSISGYAFYGCTGLTSITIPDSVTSISDSAFEDCTGLTSITIPDSVTEIGYYVFSGCTGLTSITIPDSVTEIGYHVFSGCTGLTSITIPDSVTEIGYRAFSGCTGLTSITIPDSVTEIGYMAFFDCTDLTSITIPDSVTSISEYAFYGCTNLTIKGYKGSCAEQYATESNIPFVALEKEIEENIIGDITVYGDLNGSSSVDLSDLTVLSQYLLRDITLSASQLTASDVTGDGTTDVSDLALLKQFVMNEDVKLG